MTTETLHIHYTPESKVERIEPFQANVEVGSSRPHPDVVHGQMTNATEGQIIQFELERSPVIINFRGQQYKFTSLDRTGTFALKHCRCL
jgi:hypothetical protein